MADYLQSFFTAAIQPRLEPTKSKALADVPTRQLRSWLRKAREQGGCYQPGGWGRDFSVANLTAELAQRPDKDNYPAGRHERKAARQRSAREKVGRSSS